MPICPVRLSLTPFMRAYFCEPVRIYMPARRSESIMYFSTEKNPGARCTSSRMSGEPCGLKNSTGSCFKLNSCSGLSGVTFGMFLNRLRRSVLFQTCRGPVISTAGKNRKRSVDRRFYMPCDIHDPPRVSVDPECNSVITENIGLSRGIRIRQLHIVTNNVEDGNTGKTGRVISLNYELQTGLQYV